MNKLEIIPVIDVMGGKVVHANGHGRENYPLLDSLLTRSHQPCEVITDIERFFPFKTFYIADLDAIETGQINTALYEGLSQQFPRIELLLDAGIKNKQDWQQLANYPNITPIIGSETIGEIDWLNDRKIKEKSIVSLDFKAGAFLGDVGLLENNELWSTRIIVMNIDCIASSSGPDLALLAKIKQQTNHAIIAAGGVRHEQDLSRLKEQNIDSVLLASVLHDGRLSDEILAQYA